MDLAFCHVTALEILTALSAHDDLTHMPRVALPYDCRLAADDALVERLGRRYDFSLPAHVLCRHANEVATQSTVKHELSDKARLSCGYMRLDQGLFVESPELCLTRLSSTLDVVDAARLCCWMGATYGIGFDGGLIVRNPMLDERSPRILASMKGVHGLKVARRAIRYAPPGAASPVEGSVGLMFGLPLILGGYGFGGMELNGVVDLTLQEQRQLGSRNLRCDFLWRDAGVAVEYDSNEFHTGPERIEHDSLRRNVLLHKGIQVFALTWGQVRNFLRFEEFAEGLADELGIRRRKEWDDWRDVRRDLHERLFWQKPSIGLSLLGFGRLWK